jgi:long-subunit fatty acid transport protein
MLKRLLIFFAVTLLMVSSSWAASLTQTVDISSSPNPVGSGARAMGMGGAFIGVADDATAASWNPGGLIQLETPEVSIVGAYNYRREDTTYNAFPEASGPNSVSTFELSYFSGAYPFFALNRNMIVSLNFQHLYDFNKKVSYKYSINDPSPPALLLDISLDYEQGGAFKAISPAFAVQLTPQVSLGATLNFWENGLFENKFHSSYQSYGTGTFAGIGINITTGISESYTMEGLSLNPVDLFNWENANFNLGLMWNINSKFTLGAVFKSPFEARLKHDYSFSSEIRFPTAPGSNVRNSIHQTEEVVLEMPMSYGLGVGIRLSDKFSLDLDLYRTHWDDYTLRDGSGNEMNPITGKAKDQSRCNPTTQVRFGGEYLIIGQSMIFPVRSGVFYDPEPAENSPDDFFGMSFGSGIVFKKIVYDVAYQYRFGRDVRSTTVGSEDSTQDVDQHTVYMSVIYHF